MKYIASVSFGKDSLAMLIRLLDLGYPLDEVVFYDTGMEFQAIYNIRNKVLPILEAHGIKYTELKPDYNFMYKAFEKPVKGQDGSTHYGYSWCGGRCRWGTTDKLKSLDKYAENIGAKVYIAIAADEPQRIEKQRKDYKLFPLVEWNMTEAECLTLCHERGFYWLENGVELYDILDRVSCWCCSNKNRKELKNIYKYLPEYWQRLKDFQSRTERPMKKFNTKKYGFYGNVFDMETVFEKELEG